MSNLRCSLCAGKHKLDNCTQFIKLDWSAKRDALRNFKRCFICFTPNHMAKFCTVNVRCETCGGRHHRLMHRDEASLVRQCSVAPESHSGTRLGFVPVTLKNGNQNLVTYALLDNSSNVTLLSE